MINQEAERYIARCVIILEDTFKVKDRLLEFREWFVHNGHDDSSKLNKHHLYMVADFLGIDFTSREFLDIEQDFFSDGRAFKFTSKMIRFLLAAIETHKMVIGHGQKFNYNYNDQNDLLYFDGITGVLSGQRKTLSDIAPVWVMSPTGPSPWYENTGPTGQTYMINNGGPTSTINYPWSPVSMSLDNPSTNLPVARSIEEIPENSLIDDAKPIEKQSETNDLLNIKLQESLEFKGIKTKRSFFSRWFR